MRSVDLSSSQSMRIATALVLSLGSALAARDCLAQRRYRRAELDTAGRLRIVLSSDQVIRPKLDSGQVAFDRPAVSRDRRTVGWLALYPNCCTTYPIPLALVLMRSNGARTVINVDLPIWQWGFAADGRSVVLQQAPVHGDAPVYYERRDVLTGRLLATARADSSVHGALPGWVRFARPSAGDKRPRLKEQ